MKILILLLPLILFTACGSGSSSSKTPNATTDTSESNLSNQTDTMTSNETVSQEEEKSPESLDNNDTTTKDDEVDKNTSIEPKQNQNEVDENTSSGVENNTSLEELEQDNNEVDANTSNGVESNTSLEEPEAISIEEKNLGKAQLGVLSKATVKLYELTGVEKKLLASTVTSEGDSIESIGNFDLHIEKLDESKLYVYQVSGGQDFDVNDDGIVDETPTQNQGTFHLLVLGSHLKTLKEARVTVVSEVIYQKLISSLNLSVTEVVTRMQSAIQELIKEDINEDGFVGIEDMLKFNPIVDRDKLQERYRQNVSLITNDILNAQASDYNAPIFENSLTRVPVNENITLVETLNIVDSSNVTVSLTGVDATHFNYNTNTKELSFVVKPDFENPLDSNGDNLFEVTVEAVDSYYNSSTLAMTIEVVDVNETIPEVPTLQDANFSIAENNEMNTLLGTIPVKKVGTTAISRYTLLGEDSKFFSISDEGQLFAQERFDFENKKTYQFQINAFNRIGKSNTARIDVNITNVPDVKPFVANAQFVVREHLPAGIILGTLNIWDIGDSNLSAYSLYGLKNNHFDINAKGEVYTLRSLDYETINKYEFEYTAYNDAGESERATLKIQVRNIEENTSPVNTPTTNTNDQALGKAQLGVLSKATVKLYELTGVEKKLLASTVTSEGDSIESIGNFDLHIEKLDESKLYVYQVSGGQDFDVNDDGIVDETPTQNQGTFHLLVLGSHLKTLKEARVTVVSEVIYQKLISSLNLSVTEVVTRMQSAIQELIKEDINEDGFVGIEDMLKFNPIVDRDKLQERYRQNVSLITNDILNAQASDYNAPIFENSLTRVPVNENITLVETLNIVDSSNVTVSLTGVDATHFNYNTNTKELSFVVKPDFENPLDSNGDNLFEVTVEAVDSYYNSSTLAMTIEVVDMNETLADTPELTASEFSVSENNEENILIGNIAVKRVGSSQINAYRLLGEDSKFFSVSDEGQLFAQESFDFETKQSYAFEVEASNVIGTSTPVSIKVAINNLPDVKPLVANIQLSIDENSPIATVLGAINLWEQGDSNVTHYSLYGEYSNHFILKSNGQVETISFLDYESINSYEFEYTAHNEAGESERAILQIEVKNIEENTGPNYPKTEDGIQSALDNADYDYVLTQLLNNRDSYTTLDNNEVNMNIAAAYVGSSGYTVFDILGAMSSGDTNSFNDFVNNITQDNDAVTTISKLNEADTYYSQIVQGLDCTNTSNLNDVQQNSCYNLGLVRLTSLTNAVKLLFGGEEESVEKWANGVTPNSSDDFNGNGVLDDAEASACAIVYANNPKDECQNGASAFYKAKVSFQKNGTNHDLTLLEVDVGNSNNGYQSFYQFVSNNANNNTPILTSGVCDVNFNPSSGVADGVTLFPCPTLDKSGEVMGIKENLEQAANVQDLFPDGDSTKNTLESYLTNITGSPDGTIGLDNLSSYLRSN